MLDLIDAAPPSLKVYILKQIEKFLQFLGGNLECFRGDSEKKFPKSRGLFSSWSDFKMLGASASNGCGDL